MKINILTTRFSMRLLTVWKVRKLFSISETNFERIPKVVFRPVKGIHAGAAQMTSIFGRHRQRPIKKIVELRTIPALHTLFERAGWALLNDLTRTSASRHLKTLAIVITFRLWLPIRSSFQHSSLDSPLTSKLRHRFACTWCLQLSKSSN